MSNAPRPSKNERRDAAREKARVQRERQQRREKRNRAVLQLSIGVVIIAIVAVVAVIIVNSVKPAAAGPANMADGGITLEGAQLTAVRTAGLAPGATPTPQSSGPDGKVLIQTYEDFGCPVCQEFEQANGALVKQLVSSGAAVVQYHPVAILDNNFTDNSYSTRAANAAAVIANYSPNAYAAFHSLLYRTDVQPEEQGPGLTDDRLVALAKQAGATDMTAVEKGIRDGEFTGWVKSMTALFVDDEGALADVQFPSSHTGAGTPTIIVNGKYYAGDPRDASAFGSFVTSVGGAIGSQSPSASASPSTSATP